MTYQYTKPADIESASMKIITQELAERGIDAAEAYRPVLLRVIHTTADFDYAETLRFVGSAVEKGIEALQKGAPIISDTNMARAGISKPALAKLGGEAICYMKDDAVAARAKAEGTTRAAVSMRQGMEEHPDAVFAVGNAPTALITLSELIRQGAAPSLIIGVPVGFVNVTESKEELLAVCRQYNIPAIIAMGRKGGSNVAAAICNALLYTAAGMLDPHRRM